MSFILDGEIRPNSRATCRACHTRITQGETALAISDSYFHNNREYFHAACIIKKLEKAEEIPQCAG